MTDFWTTSAFSPNNVLLGLFDDLHPPIPAQAVVQWLMTPDTLSGQTPLAGLIRNAQTVFSTHPEYAGFFIPFLGDKTFATDSAWSSLQFPSN